MVIYKKLPAQQVQPTNLKKHHKVLIGGFTTIVIVYMITTAIILNGVIVKQTINNKNINNKLDLMQADANSKINQLTQILLETQKSLNLMNDSVKSEISILKASTTEDFTGIIEEAVPSVITVRTDTGQGTGFIINEDGYFVTNAHVLFGAKEVYAITNKQDTLSAELIGYDSNLDVALLKISGKYQKLRLADSDKVSIGEKVIAIGNPLGLQFSVSQGIVSGIHRKGLNELDVYIQIDAPLNPGNSGGPLINKDGEVIGINNFKISTGESLGFALESNYIKDAVNSIYMKAVNQTLF